MAEKTTMPITGGQPSSHDDARRMDANGASLLLAVAEAKARAATPKTDLNDRALATAKTRGPWVGGWPNDTK